MSAASRRRPLSCSQVGDSGQTSMPAGRAGGQSRGHRAELGGHTAGLQILAALHVWSTALNRVSRARLLASAPSAGRRQVCHCAGRTAQQSLSPRPSSAAGRAARANMVRHWVAGSATFTCALQWECIRQQCVCAAAAQQASTLLHAALSQARAQGQLPDWAHVRCPLHSPAVRPGCPRKS